MAVLGGHPFAVGAALHALHPFGVVQILAHGFADARFKDFGGFPTQFAFYFSRVNGVATIMAGAILHVGDLRTITSSYNSY